MMWRGNAAPHHQPEWVERSLPRKLSRFLVDVIHCNCPSAMSLCHWQGERKRTATSLFAICPEPSTMSFNQMFGNCQSKSGTPA